jgi:hypothetical protein
VKLWWLLLVVVVAGCTATVEGNPTGIKPTELERWQSAQVGDCVWLDEDDVLFKVDCRTGYAAQRVVFHAEPNKACRDQDMYLWLQQDDASPRLCMVFNVATGECLHRGDHMGQAVKVECGGRAELEVVMSGAYDITSECPDEANFVVRYPYPAILLCIKFY